ncbi:MAG: hypothetical protein HN842_09320 [Gammaproteobacteria bacterium]|jgi:peptidoglycan hydrolase FlgJ|nr:hypothetical protein [Gammaproteobacteria bacterium]MBT7308408.1 hypothetical protein [Gammaproteobacteria bacterium]
MINSTINTATTANLQGQVSSTDDIRHLANRDENAALKEATKQFEALFVQMMLKSMRSTVGETDLFSSSATKTFEELQDSEFSKQIASIGGLGLTDQMVGSVMRQAGVEESPGVTVGDTLSHLRQRTSGQ